MRGHSEGPDFGAGRRRLLMGAVGTAATILPGLMALSSGDAFGAGSPIGPLTIAVPSVREFQRRYEEAVPPAPRDEINGLLQRQAPWPEMEALIASRAPNGFLIYYKLDVHPMMQLAGDKADCLAYLMGNHTIAERMFRYDPRAMLYAPLRTVIWEDARGNAWFSVDQPSSQFGRIGIPEISRVGVELDRKLAALLATLNVDVPHALLES